MSMPTESTRLFVFPDGVERVLHDVRAAAVLPGLLDHYQYRRVALVCSHTLRRDTDVVQRIETALAGRIVTIIDDVGEHAPVGNVLRGADALRAAEADVMVSVGGGSVLDFCKFVQLAISENVRSREALLGFQWRVSDDGAELLPAATSPPAIRQIAVPTTLATAEWTPGGTPIDETTRQKARLMAVRAAPIAIVYDPEILRHTPAALLAATGIRGLDHAINTACAAQPHPLASLLAEKAIALYVEHLPCLRGEATDLAVLSQLQFATWFTGMGQVSMSNYHGFSHWMVHVLAPLAGIGHSDAACVLMLAQARWFEPVARERYAALVRGLGQGGSSFPDLLEALLIKLNLPTTFADIGVDDALVEASIPLALAHPLLRRWNLREIRGADELRQLMALARGLPTWAC
jgi:maleylacetate reductase